MRAMGVFIVLATALLLLGQAVDAASISMERRSLKNSDKSDKQPVCKGENCNGVCVDRDTDLNNCGRCNNKCPEGWECKNGNCVCRRGYFVCADGTCVPSADKCNTTCVDPTPPQPVLECTCKRTITPVALNNTNRCRTDVPCDGTPGALCQTGDALACTCGAECGNFAYCASPLRSSIGGGLCYETCCDRNGTVNIQGASLRNCTTACDDVCEAFQLGFNDLTLFTGPSTIDTGSTELRVNQRSIDFTEECTAGQCFQLCEEFGIILTDTVQSSLTITAFNECPANFEQVGECTPVGCDTDGEVPDGAVCVVLDTPATPDDE